MFIMPAWLAPLIGLAGTALASGINYYAVKRTNEQQERAADIQYQRQISAIREQNQYNSPSAQVIRLRNAGINPALYYGGNGAAVAGEQRNIPEYTQPDYQAPSLDAQSVYKSVVDLTNMQTKKSEAEANIKFIVQKTNKLAQDFAKDLKLNPILIDQAKKELDNLKANEDKIRADIDEIYAKIPLLEQQVKNAAQEYDINLVELEMAISKFPKEMFLMDAESALKYAQANKANKDVQIAFASLAEVVRHNKASEKILAQRNKVEFALGKAGVAATRRGQDITKEMQDTKNQLTVFTTYLNLGASLSDAIMNTAMADFLSIY